MTPTATYIAEENCLQELPTMEAKECWLPVVGYEGLYEVSNWGRVKSLARTVIREKVGNTRFPEKILKQELKARYLYATLAKIGTGRAARVHRLVATAFIPNPDHKPHVNHKDGNKLNNYAQNLEWCTPSENSKHSVYVLGNRKNWGKGEQSKINKLTDNDIYALAEHVKSGGSIRQFAKAKNMTRQSIAAVVYGKSWRHIFIDWKSIYKPITKYFNHESRRRIQSAK